MASSWLRVAPLAHACRHPRAGTCRPFCWFVKKIAGQATSLDEARASSGLVDLLPGVTRRLVTWADDNHYFDGTVIAVAPSGTSMQNIVAAYPLNDIEDWPKRGAPPDVTLISGGPKPLYPDVSLCAPSAAGD